MVPSSHRPKLEFNAVLHALKALRLGQPLGDHPLQYFLSVRQQLHEPHMLDGTSAVEVTIFEHLSDIIVERLGTLRKLYALPAPDAACTDLALVADFQQGNDALEAWSILYHRYVCVDRNLELADIADQVHHAVRTIRRRRNLGVTYLLRHLVATEQEFRRQHARQCFTLVLPPAPPRLINAEHLLPVARHMLQQAEPPHHLVLHGPVGIGKSALAKTIGHDLIARDQLDDLAWLDLSGNVVDAPTLLLEIAARIGLPPTEQHGHEQELRGYLATHTVLIVLDDAGGVFRDARQTNTLLEALSHALVIMTSRRRIAEETTWFYEISVPPLSRMQAFELLEQLSQRSAAPYQDSVNHDFERSG